MPALPSPPIGTSVPPVSECRLLGISQGSRNDRNGAPNGRLQFVRADSAISKLLRTKYLSLTMHNLPIPACAERLARIGVKPWIGLLGSTGCFSSAPRENGTAQVFVRQTLVRQGLSSADEKRSSNSSSILRGSMYSGCATKQPMIVLRVSIAVRAATSSLKVFGILPEPCTIKERAA